MSVFDDSPKNPGAQRFLNFVLKTCALLLMTVLPAFITTLPPISASSIKFQRVEGRVIAQTQRYLFFIIPYRTEHIDPVIDVETDSQAGSITRVRRTSRTDDYKQADSQGFLLVKGPNISSSEIPADARKLDSLKSQTKAFLKDSQAKELNLYLLGNPLFTLVFGGGATAVVLLISGCFAYAWVQWLLKKLGLVKPKSRHSSGRV